MNEVLIYFIIRSIVGIAGTFVVWKKAFNENPPLLAVLAGVFMGSVVWLYLIFL